MYACKRLWEKILLGLKTLLAILLLIPSLSWANHEILICTSDIYGMEGDYSFDKKHQTLTHNYYDGREIHYNKVKENNIWAYYENMDGSNEWISVNKYTKYVSHSLWSRYTCNVYESD